MTTLGRRPVMSAGPRCRTPTRRRRSQRRSPLGTTQRPAKMATSSGPARPWRRASAHSSPMADRSPAVAASPATRTRMKDRVRAWRHQRPAGADPVERVAPFGRMRGRDRWPVPRRGPDRQPFRAVHELRRRQPWRAGSNRRPGSGGGSHRTGSRGGASAGRRSSTSRPSPRRTGAIGARTGTPTGALARAGGRLRHAACVPSVRMTMGQKPMGVATPEAAIAASCRSSLVGSHSSSSSRKATHSPIPRARRRCGPRRRRPTPAGR